MKEEDFAVLGRTWSMTRADGTPVTLKMDNNGNPAELMFEDREDYCVAVKEIRLNEFNSQVHTSTESLDSSQIDVNSSTDSNTIVR